jgi:hypothetical protein
MVSCLTLEVRPSASAMAFSEPGQPHRLELASAHRVTLIRGLAVLSHASRARVCVCVEMQPYGVDAMCLIGIGSALGGLVLVHAGGRARPKAEDRTI